MLPAIDNLTPTAFALMLKEQLVASLTVYRDLDLLITELKGDPLGNTAPKAVYKELRKSGKEIGLSLLHTRAIIDELEEEEFWEGSDDRPDSVINLLDLLSRNLSLLLALEDYQSLLDLPWMPWSILQKEFAKTNVQNWMRKSRPL